MTKTDPALVGKTVKFESPISGETVVGQIVRLDSSYPTSAYTVTWEAAYSIIHCSQLREGNESAEAEETQVVQASFI